MKIFVVLFPFVLAALQENLTWAKTGKQAGLGQRRRDKKKKGKGSKDKKKEGSKKQVSAVVNTIQTSDAAKTSSVNGRLVIHMKGKDKSELRTSPVPDDPLYNKEKQLGCFDVNIYDLVTGENIGEGTDCLDPQGPDGCGGLQVIGTSVFRLEKVTLMTRGLTTVQPTTYQYNGTSHITGSIPQPGENNILYGDGIFEGASGSVRLSGAVNMEKDEISFDCIFVFDMTEG